MPQDHLLLDDFAALFLFPDVIFEGSYISGYGSMVFRDRLQCPMIFALAQGALQNCEIAAWAGSEISTSNPWGKFPEKEMVPP